MIRAYLSPVTTAVGALITMLTLIIAVRDGQAEIVASYTAGVSIGAFASVLAAGGSTLAFITGSVTTQHAVRSIRLKFVLPVVSISILTFGIPYTLISNLAIVSLLFGGAAIAFNSLSELESGFLKRRLNTPALLWTETSCRLFGLALILTGASFALAMFLTSVTRFLLLYYFARNDPSRTLNNSETLRQKLRIAYRPSLMISSLMYVVIDRTLFLLVPLMTSGAIAGYFAAILSAQQAIAGALASGLQTSMAARSEARTQGTAQGSRSWYLKFELSIIALGIATAILGMILYKPLLGLLGVPPEEAAVLIWTIIVVTMPLALSARAVQYVLLSQEKRGAVLASTAVGASTLLGVSLWAVIGSNMLLALLSLPLAEACALVTAIIHSRIGSVRKTA